MSTLRSSRRAFFSKLIQFAHICFIAALLAAVCFSAQMPKAAHAQGGYECTAMPWDGSAVMDWNDELNWDCGYVPNINQSVLIPSGIYVNLYPNASYPEPAARELFIDAGGRLFIGGDATLTISEKLDVFGQFDGSGGTLRFESGADQVIMTNGNTLQFGNLTKQAAYSGETLFVSPGGALFVQNQLVLRGVNNTAKLNLRCTTGECTTGAQWGLNVSWGPVVDVDYVDVQDSSVSGGPLQVYHWTDSGHNTGWVQKLFSTTTTLNAPSPASPVVGQAVNFTYVVTAAEGTLTGNVEVRSGTTTLCTGTAASGGCSYTFTTAGTNPSLAAVYTGSTMHATSTSATRSLTVGAAATSVAISANKTSPVKVGTSVTFTATVSVTAPGSGTPSGSVTFQDGSTPIAGCSGIALNASNQTACTPASLAVGTHTIQALFTPANSNFQASSKLDFSFTVDPLPATTTTLTKIEPANLLVSQVATFSYAVTAAAGTPTGTVEIYSDGTLLCSGSVAAQSCQYTFTQAGAYPLITAVYPGDSNFSGSTSAASSLTVGGLATTLDLSADKTSPVLAGSTVTFTATVAVTPPGSGTPTGTVSFSDNDAAIPGCPDQTLDAAGKATCTPAPLLATGTHAIKAIYIPSTLNFLASSKLDYSFSVYELVNTSITLTSVTPNPAVIGQTVTFDFQVAAASGTPDGDVTILYGTTPLCTVAIPVHSCQYSFNTANTYNLWARYEGNSTYKGSSSASTALTVNPASTTTVLGIEQTPTSMQDKTVIVHVSVAAVAPGSGTPTGKVVVTAGTQQCEINLAEASSCPLTFTSLGSYTITASYQNQDGNFASSSDMVNFTFAYRFFIPFAWNQ